MYFASRLLLYALLRLLLSRCNLAAQINRTIDDYHGDSATGVVPVYGNEWNYGPACPACAIQLDPHYVFDQSWHEATVHPGNPEPHNVTLTFTGQCLVFVTADLEDQ